MSALVTMEHPNTTVAVVPVKNSEPGNRVRAVRPSLFLASGWFRLGLALLLTGAIWGLVFAVVAG